MDMYRKNNDAMGKKICILMSVIAAAAVLSSCRKDPVKPYDTADSAVCFNSSTNIFSLKGKSGDEIELTIPMKLVGPAVDYDREIALEIKDSTAVQGADYTVVSSKVAAGAFTGNVVIRVKALGEDVDGLYARFTVVPNEHFSYGFRNNMSSVVGWTASYARPKYEVWRYWFLLFSNGYSKALHKLLVDEFGEEIEYCTMSRNYVKNDPELVYKLPTWWYSASRQFREMVDAHDKADPEHPYMHSSDYEYFEKSDIAVGEGKKPGTIPTILETLNVF